MDNLVKQLRTNYSNVGQEYKESSSTTTKDTIPPQRTESFKGEKIGTRSWIKRQFSGSMGRESDAMDVGEFQIAVAAAAFAVKSLEESRARDERRRLSIPDAAFPNAEDTAPAPGRRTRPIKFSDEVARPNLDVPNSKVQKTAETREKMPEKPVVPAPAIRKKDSFTDTQSNSTARSQPEIAVPTEKAIGSAPSIEKTSDFDKRLDRLRRRIYEAEMAKIKEKYEKLKTTILDWEEKKITKAKRRVERIEAELDKRRAKALQDYRSEVVRIEAVAGGARSQADENRRNEEFKVKENANKIRVTGKLPATCLCF